MSSLHEPGAPRRTLTDSVRKMPCFYVYDEDGFRVEVQWSDATDHEHMLAIDRMLAIRSEVDTVIGWHREALDAPRSEEDGAELLDRAELAVYEALRALGCPVAVDPADPDDCASVAVEAVRALRNAGWDIR